MADEGRRWFEKRKDFTGSARAGSSEGPELFTKCPKCGATLFNEALEGNLRVCQPCGHHFRWSAVGRLRHMCAKGTIVVHDEELAPVDALGFVDSKPYPKRIDASRRKTGRNDAFIAASAEVDGVDVEIGSFDFSYMGGSMGSVVGEKITRLFERAVERKVPAIVISASGGARMQEGVLSLMQMAKTCAALAKLRDEAGMPYISILTDPTTGGVAASFAMLGDIILAEPGALIGFAGPRVIRETIGEELPDGFQTSEYLLDHGLIDQIVPREDMLPRVGDLLRHALKPPPREVSARPCPRPMDDEATAAAEGAEAREASAP